MPELVALDLPGGAGFVDALQAIWDTGDAAAPLDPRLPLAARNVMLDALRPTRIVGSDGEQHTLADGIPVEEGDALVVATSGTSGIPKGVVLTHDAIAASATRFDRLAPLAIDDSALRLAMPREPCRSLGRLFFL